MTGSPGSVGGAALVRPTFKILLMRILFKFLASVTLVHHAFSFPAQVPLVQHTKSEAEIRPLVLWHGLGAPRVLASLNLLEMTYS